MYLLLFQKIIAKSVGERISNIGQQSAKLEPKIEWQLFPDAVRIIIIEETLLFCRSLAGEPLEESAQSCKLQAFTVIRG